MLAHLPDQVRFATALGLTKTAFDVRKHIVESVWRHDINVRARAFAGRAFRVDKADKRLLTAWVFVDRRRVSPAGVEAINRLIEGLPHFPFSGTHLAIPVAKNTITKTGKLTKFGRAALQRSNPTTFVADLAGRGPAVWQRTGRTRKSAGRRLLFVLRPKVKTPKKFSFYESAAKQADRVWPRHARAAVDRAIRTANR